MFASSTLEIKFPDHISWYLCESRSQNLDFKDPAKEKKSSQIQTRPIPCVHPFAYVLSLKISFRIVSWYRVVSYRTCYFVVHALAHCPLLVSGQLVKFPFSPLSRIFALLKVDSHALSYILNRIHDHELPQQLLISILPHDLRGEYQSID